MRKVYICMDEIHTVLGVFSTKKDAEKWCDKINNDTQYDSVATVYPFVVAKRGWIKTPNADVVLNFIKKNGEEIIKQRLCL